MIPAAAVPAGSPVGHGRQPENRGFMTLRSPFSLARAPAPPEPIRAPGLPAAAPIDEISSIAVLKTNLPANTRRYPCAIPVLRTPIPQNSFRCVSLRLLPPPRPLPFALCPLPLQVPLPVPHLGQVLPVAAYVLLVLDQLVADLLFQV